MSRKTTTAKPVKAMTPKWAKAWELVAKEAEGGSVDDILRKVVAAEAHIQVLTGGMGDDAHRRMEHVFRSLAMLRESGTASAAATLSALFNDEE